MTKEKPETKIRYSGNEDVIQEEYTSLIGTPSWNNLVEEMEAYDRAIKPTRQRRNEQNSVSSKHRKERDALSKRVKDCISEVKDLREYRDEANREVKLLKEARKAAVDALQRLRSEMEPDGREYERANTTQQECHNRVVEAVKKAQVHHDDVMRVSARVDALKAEQKEAHRALRSSKRKADRYHAAMLMFLARRNFLRDALSSDD